MKKSVNNNIDRNKFLLKIIICIPIFLLIFLGVIYAMNINKGELNGDGQIDYADVHLLEMHLIHKQELAEDKLKNADMNSDGEITVTDLTLLIQKIEKKLDYEVEVFNIELENYYPNKNEEITLNINAIVSYGANIKTVIINETEYELEQLGNEQYELKVNVGDTAGIKEYHFTEVILENERSIKVDNTLKIDVLKEIPTIENYKVEENLGESKLKVSFNIVDTENSFTTGKVEIINDANEVIKEDTLTRGENQIEVPVEEGKKYNATFVIDYNLSSKVLTQEGNYEGMLQLSKTLQLTADYQFNISNITTSKNDTQSTEFEKSEPIQISFESNNTTKFEPATIKVMGKEYEVTKQGDTYIATIDAITEFGIHEITVEEVVLENGKSFALENDNKITINIIKRKPTVTDLTMEEDTTQNNIKVSFSLNDEDKTIKNASIVLTNIDGTELAKQDLSTEDLQNGGKIEKTFSTIESSEYKVKVVATYNQTQNEENEVVNSILAEKEIEATAKATIIQADIDKEYVEKGEKLSIIYHVETDKTETISKIRVNNTDYIPFVAANGQYQVEVEASNNSGICELVATKIIFSDETVANVNNTIKIDVLKDTPSFENLIEQDNIEENKTTLSFNIKDDDNSFKSGKAIFTNNEDNSKQEKHIQVGENSIEFDIENGKTYTLEIKVNYDRDSNKLEGKPEEDNLFVDEVLVTREIQILADYEFTFNNFMTYKDESQTKYFEKQQNIIIKFDSTNVSKSVPKKAVIDGQEYELTKNETTYQTNLNGYEELGVKNITIEKVILDNGKEFATTENNRIQIEILKDKPTVTDFGYSEGENNIITAVFKLNDAEHTIKNGNIVILDEQNNQIKTQKLNITEEMNTISFEKQNGKNHLIKVTASYDLDTNTLESGKNEYQNEVLLNDEIDFTEREIQLKDIMNVNLYHIYYGFAMEATNIDSNKIIQNPENYVAKVKMKNMPDMYATIKSCRVENRVVLLELNVENTVIYKGDEKQAKVEVPFGKMGTAGSYVNNENFESLIRRIKEYPDANITLTKDYDASEYKVDTTTYLGDDIIFRGTINGNGHTIYNLQKPLFNEMQKASVRNLVIENAYLSSITGSAAKGVIANSAESSSVISNVHIKNATIAAYGNNGAYFGYGSIAGRISSNTRIEKCSSTNLNIIATKGDEAGRVGGIVGQIGYNSTIEDCYVTGNISGSLEVGGIVGGMIDGLYQPNTIKHCITKVNITGTSGVGGIAGNPNGSGRMKLVQNISLSDGNKGFKVHGNAISLDPDTFNYEMTESKLSANAPNSNGLIKEISKDEFNGEFCKEQAGFSDTIWNLNNKNYNELPSLNNADPNNKQEVTINGNYIPDLERIQKMDIYNENKETLYANLYYLMPFFDSRYLVVDGAKISEDHVLNKKAIKTVLPYNKDNTCILALTEENYNTIDHINIVFTDNSSETYKVRFKNMKGHVASYKVEGLGIEYNFNNYIVRQDAQIVKELVNYIKNLEYNRDLKGLGSIALGERIYADFFNEITRSEENATQFILNYFANVRGYSITFDNDILNQYIKADLTGYGEKLKQAIYAYNYYSRFYGIEVNGVNIADMLFFKGELYQKNANTKNLIKEFLKSKWKASHVTQMFFKETLGPCVNSGTVQEFIEKNIRMFANNQDPNDWFTENFNGILEEVPIAGKEDSIDYRAWTQLKKQEKFILPVLTLPKDSAYMISAPTTFIIGSQRVYVREPGNEAQVQNLRTLAKNFANQIGVFYSTASGFIEPHIFNQICDIAIDTTVLPVLGEQKKDKATDPFCKNFNELLYEWFTIRGVAAYSGSNRIYYVVDNALTSYSRTWSHETGHNQCNFLFFKRNGFRPVGGCNNNDGSGTEDYTDGNTTQGFGDGAVNFNLSYNFNNDQLITTNLTTERINTTEKIESYYKGMFEAIDFLDYAEAKAFLRLTPEEQSKVAVQIYYPNAPGNYANVGWKPISKEEFEEMNLKTIEDIYDNQITIKPGVTAPVTQTGEQGLYGSENMYIRRWYQPYNEKGRTHSYGFTYTSWQMLGIGGYDGGYITYFSGKSKNDLDAIQKVTKDPTMTWKKFKTGRYELMEDSWNTIPYLNADDLVDKYVEALKLDATNSDRNITNSTNVRRMNYHYLKRVTNDFREEVLDGDIEKIHITSAEQFKQKLTENPYAYYVLDNDIDLSGVSEGNSIIDGCFMGKLDGQGHKLTGNTVPIFNNIKFAHISNLKIENSNITSNLADVGALAKTLQYSEMENVLGNNINIQTTNKQVGGLVGSMVNCFVKNVHVTELQVSGTARVGMISGYVGQSQIEECSSNGNVVSTGNAVGGLLGEIYNKTTVRNCYSVGEAKGNQDIGGFVGYVNTSYIINCFSNTKATGNAGTASFTGQTIGNSIIKNNITLVNQTTGYKFDGRTANNKFTNFSGNYENKANVGKSTLTRTGIDFTGKISIAEGTEFKKESFYTETLTWDNNIWDFSQVATGGLPKLKNDDPNNITSTSEIYSITNAEEFERLLKEHREATFVIEQDIDLSTIETTTTIIDGVFMGRIEGNNHTLRGNTVPIFHTIRYAQISNLKLEESNVTKSESDVGALAKISDYVELNNVVAKNINVSNRSQDTGGLIGIMTYTNVQNVHIIGANISGTNRVGALVGYVGYSNIKESSSNGKVTASGNAAGGFMGEVINGTTIENSYSIGEVIGTQNVGGFIGNLNKSTIINCLSTVKVDGDESAAGFIGQSGNNSIVKNNISLGNQARNKYKFDGKTIQEQLGGYENNYEYAGNKGISTLTREGIDFTGKISVANTENITSEEFYTNTLDWNKEIWDFSNISGENIPKLKNSDPNEVIGIRMPVHAIHTAEEFETLLNQYPEDKFTIENDIDLSTLNKTTTIVDGTFYGEIEGNSHILKGNTVPIFNKICHMKMSDVKLEGSNINKNEIDVGALAKVADDVELTNIVAENINVINKKQDVGGFIGIMTNSNLENVHIIGANISGTSRIGDLVGYVGNSTIKGCSSNGTIVATGNAIGGLIGEAINNTIIENCYSVGDANGNQDIGGLVGILRESTIINCFSVVKVSGNAGVAGFIGQAANNSIVKNNIALGNQFKQYKFDGRTNQEQFEGYEGNYEYEENSGTSNLTREGIDFTGKISVANKENVTSEDFYTNTLGWNKDIWDFSNIAEENIPKLKNADPNDKIAIHAVESYSIHSADEFIQLITAHRNAVFTIENDIDFSGKKFSIGSTVISGVFAGEIKGNNHAIRNLKDTTLFEQFEGKVDGLNIEDCSYGVKWKNGFIDWSVSNPLRFQMATFAKKAINAKFTNMKFNNITMLGKYTYAIVVSDDQNCTYENINIKNAYINGRASGSQIATIAAIKTGGTIKNCYIQAGIYAAGVQNGGIISISKGDITIENVISNVYMACSSNADSAKNWGGLVYKVENGNLVVKNSAVITKQKQTNNQINKVISTINEGANVIFENCYENADSIGITNSDKKGIQTVINAELLTKDFYTNVLHLDENIWNLDNIQEIEITNLDNLNTENPVVKFITFGLKDN